MMKLCAYLLISALVVCVLPFQAQAWNQLPLRTVSPTVLPPGIMQFDLGLQYLSNTTFLFSDYGEDSGRDALTCPALGFTIGLGKHVDFHLNYEVLFIKEEEFQIREQWKSGDLAFFTRIQLWKEHPHFPAAGLRVGAKLPNAQDQYRVGTDETDLAFSALFEKSFSPFTITTNLGLLILGDPEANAQQDDLLTYALAGSLPLNDQLSTTLEIVGQAFGTSHNERSSVIAHLAFQEGPFTWKLSGRVGLLENSEEWGFAAGVSWTFSGGQQWFAD